MHYTKPPEVNRAWLVVYGLPTFGPPGIYK